MLCYLANERNSIHNCIHVKLVALFQKCFFDHQESGRIHHDWRMRHDYLGCHVRGTLRQFQGTDHLYLFTTIFFVTDRLIKSLWPK